MSTATSLIRILLGPSREEDEPLSGVWRGGGSSWPGTWWGCWCWWTIPSHSWWEILGSLNILFLYHLFALSTSAVTNIVVTNAIAVRVVIGIGNCGRGAVRVVDRVRVVIGVGGSLGVGLGLKLVGNCHLPKMRKVFARVAVWRAWVVVGLLVFVLVTVTLVVGEPQRYKFIK